jgi:hypothetical protein
MGAIELKNWAQQDSWKPAEQAHQMVKEQSVRPHEDSTKNTHDCIIVLVSLVIENTICFFPH